MRVLFLDLLFIVFVLVFGAISISDSAVLSFPEQFVGGLNSESDPDSGSESESFGEICCFCLAILFERRTFISFLRFGGGDCCFLFLFFVVFSFGLFFRCFFSFLLFVCCLNLFHNIASY